MCGICGIFSPHHPIDSAVLQKMCDAIQHRGPDDHGIYIHPGIGLGNRRLSIIDLSTGHQPIGNVDGSVWITFNGEIYNYRELMPQLQNRGCRFRTSSDTEVILHSYEEYGVDCLQQFNGMFAFAIWDDRRKLLFIARDRVGEKPLYYLNDGQRLVFASEIKSILVDRGIPRRVDYKGLNNYFTFGHAVAPDTIYEGIKKLLPGHYLLASEAGVEIHQYWDAPREQSDGKTGTIDEYAEQLYSLLKDAVRYRMIADVPLGAFLSGGIDSSTIVGLMSELAEQPVKTFSIGFDTGTKEFNELDDARIVARHFQTDHHELLVQPKDLHGLLEKLVYHYDEPFGDAACFPTYLVSHLARQHVTVALTGEGGDEVFGGYRKYSVERFSTLYQSLPTLVRDHMVSPAVRRVPRTRRLKQAIRAFSAPDAARRFATWTIVFTDEMKHELFSRQVGQISGDLDSFERYRQYYPTSANSDLISRMMYTDLKTWLPDTYLEKVDKASMAVSLEARVPMLDHRLIEFMARLPGSFKVHGLTTKYLLRRAVRRLLPSSVLSKPKHGFAVPTDSWFRGELKDYVFDILMDERTRQRGYFNVPYVEHLYNMHREGKEVYDSQLWLLLNFELWARTFLDEPVQA